MSQTTTFPFLIFKSPFDALTETNWNRSRPCLLMSFLTDDEERGVLTPPTHTPSRIEKVRFRECFIFFSWTGVPPAKGSGEEEEGGGSFGNTKALKTVSLFQRQQKRYPQEYITQQTNKRWPINARLGTLSFYWLPVGLLLFPVFQEILSSWLTISFILF